MKIIPKFQQGGGLESLFTIYQPVQIETPRQAPASSRSSKSKDEDDDDKGKITEKDLLTMLKDLDGLPNEMQALVEGLMSSLRAAKAFGSSDLNDLAVTYIGALSKLKQAKYNRDLFKDTYERAVANNSLNDVAITLSGEILTLDKNNKITPFSPEEWAKVKNTRKYRPLTNSNLLWLRSHKPEYINDNKVFQIVENGIGLESVHKMIKDRFQKLGTTETSSDFFIPTDVAKGQKIIGEMLQYGPEGYYKLTKELSTVDQQAITATITYIYGSLPANAKARLAMETQTGTQKSVQDFITAMLFGTVDSKFKTSAQYLGSEAKLEGEGGEGKNNMNIAQKLLAGYGAPETFGVNIGDSKLTLVQSNVLPLVGKGDNPLEVRQPISKVTESSLGGLLNLNSASMGGQIIPSYELNHIITQDAKIRTIDFPCIINEDGTIVPNISPEISKRKKEADSELQQMGINVNDSKQVKTQYQTINQVYQKYQLDPPYTPSGELNKKWARFAILAVATDGRGLEFADKSLLEVVPEGGERESIISAIQESDKNYTFDSGWAWNRNHIYKGVLWVPLYESYNAASATNKISSKTAMQYDIWDQAINNKVPLSTKQYY